MVNRLVNKYTSKLVKNCQLQTARFVREIVLITEGTLELSVWLAQLVKALAALTHVRSHVQEVRVRSPEQTSSTLASIPPG